jgi:hypothetical protein
MKTPFPPVVYAGNRKPSQLIAGQALMDRPWSLHLKALAEYFVAECSAIAPENSDEAYKQAEVMEFENRLLAFIAFYNLKMVSEYLGWRVKLGSLTEQLADKAFKEISETAHRARGNAMHQGVET